MAADRVKAASRIERVEVRNWHKAEIIRRPPNSLFGSLAEWPKHWAGRTFHI